MEDCDAEFEDDEVRSKDRSIVNLQKRNLKKSEMRNHA